MSQSKIFCTFILVKNDICDELKRNLYAVWKHYIMKDEYLELFYCNQTMHFLVYMTFKLL